jgi:hypothetical protein
MPTPNSCTRAVLQASIATLAIFTDTAGAAFAGLHGSDWYADEDYVRIMGRARLAMQSTKFCSRVLGELECKDDKAEPSKPDYYLLECDRNRGVCEGTQAIMSPSGEPWMTKIEFKIISWTREHITATPTNFFHRCVESTLQIDLDSKEVILAETWTKFLKDGTFCIPENLGHTTTYKLEDY